MPGALQRQAEESVQRAASMGVSAHYATLPGAFASAVSPLCRILAAAGAVLAAAAVRRWKRSRIAGDIVAAETARRSLADCGLLVLSVSVVWIAACAREVFGPLIVLDSSAASLDSLRRDFTVSAWLPGALAVWGLLATLFGTLHLRRRGEKEP